MFHRYEIGNWGKALWSKVTINQLKDFIDSFIRTFLRKYSPASQVELMWEEFKVMCLECVNLIQYISSSGVATIEATEAAASVKKAQQFRLSTEQA